MTLWVLALVLLVAMTRLEKCCITSAYLQQLFHSDEHVMAGEPLVFLVLNKKYLYMSTRNICFFLFCFGFFLEIKKIPG